jgi:hypothetical protein
MILIFPKRVPVRLVIWPFGRTDWIVQADIPVAFVLSLMIDNCGVLIVEGTMVVAGFADGTIESETRRIDMIANGSFSKDVRSLSDAPLSNMVYPTALNASTVKGHTVANVGGILV